MEGGQSAATSEEGYGDWPGADYLLSSSMYDLPILLLCCFITLPKPVLSQVKKSNGLVLSQEDTPRTHRTVREILMIG